MTIKNLATLLPALSTISAGAARQARRGKSVRLYREEMQVLNERTRIAEAVKELLILGVPVKVYEGSSIYTPTLEGDTVVWNERSTAKSRKSVVVEVAL
jgi:hypothetical protein